MKILYLVDQWQGCAWHRAHTPGVELEKRGHEVIMTDKVRSPEVIWADVLVGQRLFEPAAIQAFRTANRLGKLTVYDIDDDLWSIHPSNPAYLFWKGANLEGVEELLRVSTTVTTTCQTLHGILRRFNDNVKVLPNMLPEWGVEHIPSKDGHLRLGWAGGSSHEPDFAVVRDVLLQLLTRYDNLEVLLMGADPRWLPAHKRISHIPTLPGHLYQENIRQFDIAFAPLVDNRFNRSKSDLKVLEYATLGIPSVASKVTPYVDTPALLARNDKDWLRLLSRLIEDSDYRAAKAAESSRWAATRTITENVGLWEDAYKGERRAPKLPKHRSTSIIIPCYNHAQYLPDAIESALTQSVECEVIVVDDGSTDDSAEVASCYPVKLLRQENAGLGAARNTGIRVASGTNLMNLDADDILVPYANEAYLEADSDGIVRAGLRHFGDDSDAYLPWSETRVADFVKGNKAFGGSMYSKKAWESVGGYDEHATMRLGWEDWDFWVRVLHAGWPIVNVPELLYLYRQHGTSLVDTANANAEVLIEYMHAKWKALGIRVPE